MKVKFIGSASDDVTGSNIMVCLDNGKNILLDCGMTQTNNLFKDYRINSADFPFKVKDINSVILSHLHCDHAGLLPKLYNRGYKNKLLVPYQSKPILKDMLDDSRYIISKTQQYIQSQGKKTKICYDKVDVERCIGGTAEYPFNERIYLDKDTYIMFIPSGHIACSAQVVVWYKGKTVGYTGDLGNTTNLAFYTNEFTPIRHVDVLIGECTYGQRERNTAKRSDDLTRLKAIISETKEKVLIPCFALGRTQEIVTHLYDMNIKEKVYIDSPLSSKITYKYSKIFDMEEVLEWQNLKIVDKWQESQSIMSSMGKMVICSSQGMLSAGRSLEYAKQIISNPLCTIVFVGYCANGTLGRQLQEGKKQVKIMGVDYDVDCRIETLHSFSSHMQRPQLLDYYSSVNTQKIILTHGSTQAKLDLKEDLEKILSDKCKSTKVLISEKGMEVEI